MNLRRIRHFEGRGLAVGLIALQLVAYLALPAFAEDTEKRGLFGFGGKKPTEPANPTNPETPSAEACGHLLQSVGRHLAGTITRTSSNSDGINHIAVKERVGRDQEVEDLESRILAGHNIAVVGKKNVGKDSLVHRFVDLSEKGELSKEMKNVKIHRIDWRSMAQTSRRQDEKGTLVQPEGPLLKIMQNARDARSKGSKDVHYLYIPNIDELLGPPITEAKTAVMNALREIAETENSNLKLLVTAENKELVSSSDFFDDKHFQYRTELKPLDEADVLDALAKVRSTIEKSSGLIIDQQALRDAHRIAEASFKDQNVITATEQLLQMAVAKIKRASDPNAKPLDVRRTNRDLKRIEDRIDEIRGRSEAQEELKKLEVEREQVLRKLDQLSNQVSKEKGMMQDIVGLNMKLSEIDLELTKLKNSYDEGQFAKVAELAIRKRMLEKEINEKQLLLADSQRERTLNPTKVDKTLLEMVGRQMKVSTFANTGGGTAVRGDSEFGTKSTEFEVEGIPDTGFDDIGGMHEVKAAIKKGIFNPVNNPEAAKAYRVPPRAVIGMYSYPGNGKTLMAKAIAHELGGKFMNVNAANIKSTWVSQGAKNVKSLFKAIREQSQKDLVAASKEGIVTVFLDEFDSIGGQRGGFGNKSDDEIVNQFLQELDGVGGRVDNVVIIVASNRPDLLDDALIRPGRIDQWYFIPNPDLEAREAILKINMKKMQKAFEAYAFKPEKDEAIDYFALAKKLEGYTGADIASIIQQLGNDKLNQVIDDYMTKFPDHKGPVPQGELKPITHADVEAAIVSRKDLPSRPSDEVKSGVESFRRRRGNGGEPAQGTSTDTAKPVDAPQASDVAPEQLIKSLVREIKGADFKKEVLQSSKPVLIQFMNPSCGPCKSQRVEVEALANENPGMKVVILDGSQNLETLKQYGVSQYPTTMIFHKKGEIAFRQDGFVPGKVKGEVQTFLDTNYPKQVQRQKQNAAPGSD